MTLRTLNDSITIVFHNVRSLHLHVNDVQSDYNIQKADTNIFVETRLCALDKDDVYNMEGFTLYRNDYNHQLEVAMDQLSMLRTKFTVRQFLTDLTSMK